jgi:diguanylate cyclase (GGDEF)-like protein
LANSGALVLKSLLSGKSLLPDGLREALRPVWPVAGLLALAVITAWLGRPLPDSLAGLHIAGPYIVLTLAAAVALWFNRGRAFVLALSLLAAFAAYHRALSQLALLAGSIFVFVNAILALALPERGARFGRAWRWIALVAVEILLVYTLVQPLGEGRWMEHWLLRPAPTSLLMRIAFAGAFGLAVARGWPHYSPLDIGIAGALAAYLIGCTWLADPRIYSLFMTAAGAVLVVAVLQESHRMAFRDALTGLPNRRALEEQLRALKPPYAIAMVDVDHFKKFNDTHGHDIGDQVLRLVAARLAEVKGGGRTFRYGGEEFTVLFPGSRLAEVMPHLEASRAAVETYKMTARGDDRPKDKKEGSKRRSARELERMDKLLSVTVSIGGAEPGKRLKTPAEVVKGADEALYRAKERGRNQVSR